MATPERIQFQDQEIGTTEQEPSQMEQDEEINKQDKGSIHGSRRSSLQSSRSSSSISSLIIRKQVEAESAKAKLDYVKRRAALIRRQTEIKAELNAECAILEQEQKIAVAEAEIHALQSMCGSDNGSNSSILPPEDRANRTQEYVNNLPSTSESEQAEPNKKVKDNSDTGIHGNNHVTGNHDNHQATGSHDNSQTKVNDDMKHSSQQQCSPQDFSQFLLRKDLMLSRIQAFNDRPESFPLWKCTFKDIVKEIKVSSTEEFDLLLRWLGPESRVFAHSLRSSNISDPDKGLRLVWERLEDRYGSPVMIESSLNRRLEHFPKITNRDSAKMYELADLLAEIECTKQDSKYSSVLAHFDSSVGVNPIVLKLPHNLQDKWTSNAFQYKEKHKVTFPPFSEFVSFIQRCSKLRNDPSFQYFSSQPQQKEKTNRISINKTEVKSDKLPVCPIHNSNHSMADCKTFKAMPYDERKTLVMKKGLCFRCLNPHLATDCKETCKCKECGSTRHATALHMERQYGQRTGTGNGSKESKSQNHIQDVSSNCTEVCNNDFQGRSCAKHVPVFVYPEGQRHKAVQMYASIDDQSNASLCKSSFFDIFQIESNRIRYSLTSCNGQVETSGRRASGFVIESYDRETCFQLPTLIECDDLPNKMSEIATPEVAYNHAHLRQISDQIPPLIPAASIELLIGRDLPDVHHVVGQLTGPAGSPYAQKLPLGWVIVGETCIGKFHRTCVNVNKTHLLTDGRTSLFDPCGNRFNVKEDEDPIFKLTKDDDKPGLSVEDEKFLKIMDKEMIKGPEGNWVAPLPFKENQAKLPNNKRQAEKRAKSLEYSMKKNDVKKSQMLEFMQKIMDAGHAEKAPDLNPEDEAWYLPLFGVYHPKKPNQIRGVFDSSALYDGQSLNNCLLQGPDLTNCLVAILLRFRRERVGIMGDIEQMFHSFHVSPHHRNFLRFLWYEDNDPNKEMIDYRMRVHVFGNRPSPAVATYGLRKTADTAAPEYGQDMKEFVHDNFYVDDGLTSLSTPADAIDLVTRTQRALKDHGNMRFHKICSNSREVMEAFPSMDRTKDLKDLDFSKDTFPLQRSLGVSWDVKSDAFTFHVSALDRPYTKRGVLSTINSLYDPMGFVAPVTITGKLLLRRLTSGCDIGWDETLSTELNREWETWKQSLRLLEQVQIPRTFVPLSFNLTSDKQVLVYSDASEQAIAAVAYLKVTSPEGDTHIGFIMGKTKVAPQHGHTIPRLELCAAVLAIHISDDICEYLELSGESVIYHTDSKIVLGYIRNQTKRFCVNIRNRVARIHKSSTSQQWRYVATQKNPADHGTRCVPASEIGQNAWLIGPSPATERTDLDSTDLDTEFEVIPDVTVQGTDLKEHIGLLDNERFSRFSTWKSLVRAISRLNSFARNQGDSTAAQLVRSENFILRQVQIEHYREEMECISSGQPIPKNSSLLSLNPYMDEEEVLRIGGRLGKGNLPAEYKNPVIIPKQHHVATLLVRHYHDSVQHQGISPSLATPTEVDQCQQEYLCWGHRAPQRQNFA